MWVDLCSVSTSLSPCVDMCSVSLPCGLCVEPVFCVSSLEVTVNTYQLCVPFLAVMWVDLCSVSTSLVVLEVDMCTNQPTCGARKRSVFCVSSLWCKEEI